MSILVPTCTLDSARLVDRQPPERGEMAIGKRSQNPQKNCLFPPLSSMTSTSPGRSCSIEGTCCANTPISPDSAGILTWTLQATTEHQHSPISRCSSYLGKDMVGSVARKTAPQDLLHRRGRSEGRHTRPWTCRWTVAAMSQRPFSLYDSSNSKRKGRT